MTSPGDLVYLPAETMLLQYNREVEELDLDPNKTYIGPAPIKYKRLEKSANLLLIEEKCRNNCSKVWFEGEEWYVKQ